MARTCWEPGLIRVFEAWSNRAALDLHFATPHIAAWRAAWAALGIGERDLKAYEAADPVSV
jgi:quinol monooxygenase YgiN